MGGGVDRASEGRVELGKGSWGSIAWVGGTWGEGWSIGREGGAWEGIVGEHCMGGWNIGGGVEHRKEGWSLGRESMMEGEEVVGWRGKR